MSEPTDPFSTTTVAAIVRHMNEDHAPDSLLICRHLGGHPEARAARLVTFDPDGATFEATVGAPTEPVRVAVRIAWTEPVTERRQVREQIVAMFDRALAAGGLPPRDAATH